jgi:hypothetical protein
VNNWFGNKRMRYKRKMLEESKKGSVIPTEIVQIQEQMNDQLDTHGLNSNISQNDGNNFQNWE